MSRTWRVGVLGLGHWYSAFGIARALRDYPKATLAAAAWHRADQLAEFTSAFGVEGHAEYAALLNRHDIDIVLIAAPVAEIPDLAIAAARAGKHMVLGKPMAMTLDQADRMVEAITAAGVVCVAFQGLMRLRATALKERIAGGEIGDLAVMHQTSRWSIAEDWYRSGTPGWFVDPTQVPGGALIDEGIYTIDLFRWLAGSEIVEVEAKIANLVHKDLAVEDWGLAQFTFANGMFATLEASWTITSPRSTGPSPKQNSVVRLELVGTRGEYMDQWFRVPGRAVLAAGAEDWIYEREAGEPFGPPSPSPLDHLIDCLESNRPTPASVEEARKSFRVAMAAYRSAREGRPVRVDGSMGV
jgi:predicted dehydrogenase